MHLTSVLHRDVWCMCIGYRMYGGVPGGVAGLAKGCCHMYLLSVHVWGCTRGMCPRVYESVHVMVQVHVHSVCVLRQW